MVDIEAGVSCSHRADLKISGDHHSNNGKTNKPTRMMIGISLLPLSGAAPDTAAGPPPATTTTTTVSMGGEREGGSGSVVGSLSCNSSSCSNSTATTTELMLDEEMSPHHPNYNNNINNNDGAQNQIHSVCSCSLLTNDVSLTTNNNNNSKKETNPSSSSFSNHKFRHSSTTTTTTRPPSTMTRSQSVASTSATTTTTTTTTLMTAQATSSSNLIERAPLSGRLLPMTGSSSSSSNKPTTHTQSSSTSSSKSTSTNNTTSTSTSSHLESRLLHPLLAKIPIQFRFGFTGFLSNVLFMGVYNVGVDQLSHMLQPTTLYAILYFFFIPASHFLLSLFVFGWPERYWNSLINNFPIGLTALAIGCLLTAYLDQAGFNDYVAQQLPRLYDEWWLANGGSSSSSSGHMGTLSPGLMGESPQLETQDDDTIAAAFALAEVRRTLEDETTMTTTTMTATGTGGDEEASNVGTLYSSVVVLVVTSLWTYVLSLYVNSPRGNVNNKSHEKEL